MAAGCAGSQACAGLPPCPSSSKTLWRPAAGLPAEAGSSGNGARGAGSACDVQRPESRVGACANSDAGSARVTELASDPCRALGDRSSPAGRALDCSPRARHLSGVMTEACPAAEGPRRLRNDPDSAEKPSPLRGSGSKAGSMLAVAAVPAPTNELFATPDAASLPAEPCGRVSALLSSTPHRAETLADTLPGGSHVLGSGAGHGCCCSALPHPLTEKALGWLLAVHELPAWTGVRRLRGDGSNEEPGACFSSGQADPFSMPGC